MVRICLIFVMVHTLWATIITTSTAQHSSNSPYSLQPAIDALHRRAAQLALREYDNSHNDGKQHISPNSIASDGFEPETHRKQLNHLLAKYLERVEQREQQGEEPYDEYQDLNDYDERAFEERKRSIFRERGGNSNGDGDAAPYPSVFRERDNEKLSQATPSANQFLHEIDNERNMRNELKYRQNLARAIEQYEEEEDNALEREAIAEALERNAILGGGAERKMHGPQHLQRKQIDAHWDGPIRDLIEKRQMTLPWLPASKRKRFPISKRSPNVYVGVDSSTADKVSHDLDALFGDEMMAKSNVPLDAVEMIKVQKKSDRVSELQDQSQHHDDSILSDPYVPTHPYMPSDDESNEHEHEHEHDPDHHHHDHDHDHDREHHSEEDSEEDDDSEFDEEDISERKRKRSADSAAVASKSIERLTNGHIKHNVTKGSREEFKIEQVVGNGHNHSEQSNLTDATNSKADSIERIPNKRKKSIQWSKYLGLDRKKKSVDDWFMSKHKTEQFDQENPINGQRPLEAANDRNNDVSQAESLDNIDQNLKSIENHIIDDAIKYTGSKQGITNSDEIENLKNHIVSRLATAYSLEKMRKTLTKLREQREHAQHLEQNEIPDDDADDDDEKRRSEKAKRVAIKKEKVEFDNNQHSIDTAASPEHKSTSHLDGNRFEQPPLHLGNENGHEDNDKKKKKKKRNNLLPFGDDDIEDNAELDEVFSGARRPYGSLQKIHPNRFEERERERDYDDLLNECPVLDAIDKRCQNVDMISNAGGANGQITDALLPACGVHQFCYLCGTSRTFCDFQYLSETDAICQSDRECQSTAHLVLMILRGSTSGPQQIGPKECAKNPCLLQAMKNSAIGY